ncbi:MAG: AI-2E family transporter [Chloroflexi bacterium]|nr:AI-2E family transporter [Chloroflexota bacterium]
MKRSASTATTNTAATDGARVPATADEPARVWSRPAGTGASAWHLTPKAKLVTFWTCVGLALLFLWAVRSIVQPFVIAIILAYVLNPLVVAVSERAKVPRIVAVTGIYIILAMLLTWGALVVLPVATREARELAVALPRLLLQFQDTLAQEEAIVLFGVEVEISPLSDELTRTLGGIVTTASHRLVETAVATVETLLKGILALVATFYLLMNGDRFRTGVRRLTPPRFRQEFGPVVSDIDRILGQFVRGEVLLIAIMSFATWLALTLLGIRYALILGLIAGVLELIPFIGPIMAAIPAVAMALFQPSPHGWSPLVNAGVVALTYFVLRHAEDYFVIPQVVGRVVELHPLVAMFAIFSGAAVGGILGMFLAVPVAAVLRIVVRFVYFKLTEEPVEPVEPTSD